MEVSTLIRFITYPKTVILFQMWFRALNIDLVSQRVYLILGYSVVFEHKYFDFPEIDSFYFPLFAQICS